jgi:hypothetical protein
MLYGQEVFLQSSVVAPAGNSVESNTLNISKWRLALVHQVILKEAQVAEPPIENLPALPGAAWKVHAFPNPFNRALSLYIQSEQENEFIVRVTDISGKQWFLRELNVVFNELASFDLSFLPPGIYLVTIASNNDKHQKVIKVQKI